MLPSPLLLPLWCLIPPALAQEASAEEDTDTDAEADEEVVVVSRTESPAADLPLSVTAQEVGPVVGPGLSLGEAVVTVPGVVVRNRGNLAQGPRIAIRGFGARSAFGVRGVTVVLDGIPLTLADGLAQVDMLDPDLLGRIEVLRGPAAALYGNAAGGVLSLQTASPHLQGEEASVRVGDFGLRKLVLRAEEEVSAGRGEVVLAASALTLDGPRQRSAAERWVAHASARHDLGDRSEVRLVASLVEVPQAQDAGALTAEERQEDPLQAAPNNLDFRAGESVSQGQVGLRVQNRLSAEETLEVSLYGVDRRYAGSVPYSWIDLDRQAGGVMAGLRSVRLVGGMPARLTLAAEASGLRDQRRTFDNDAGKPAGTASLIQQEAVGLAGGYGQTQLAPTPALLLLAGVRADRAAFRLTDRLLVDGDGSDRRVFGAVTGMVGSSLRLGEHAAGYLHLADAYETPTISELSQRADGEAGFVEGLTPQRARSAEAGLRGQGERWQAEAGGFAMALRDELVAFSDETGRTYYRNAGRSSRLGAEAAARLSLPGAGLALAGSASWVQARFAEGTAVPGVVPLRLAGQASWGLEQGPFLSLDGEYLSAVFVDDDNQHTSPAQGIVGGRAGLRGRWARARLEGEVYVGGTNLLDAAWVDNVRINADGERFYEPGWPRFLFGGLTLRRTASPPGDS